MKPARTANSQPDPVRQTRCIPVGTGRNVSDRVGPVGKQPPAVRVSTSDSSASPRRNRLLTKSRISKWSAWRLARIRSQAVVEL